MFPESRKTLFAVLFASALPLASASAQSNTQPPVRIRGEIVSIDAETLVVHRANADNVTVHLSPDVVIGAVKNVKLADIGTGSYIGAASVPDADGKLVAREVVVFPESMRGNGDGHRDWDLQPGSKMTNANVDAVVQSKDGRELTLSYKGGTKTVTVPVNAPVVTFADATRADIRPGKKVFVIASSTGSGVYEGRRVVVEKDGVAPPM